MGEEAVTGVRVVVVAHDDSYTWNLVHLLASVTGELPTVVGHDRVRAQNLTAFSHVVLSPGPGHPAEPTDFALGEEVFRLGVPVLGVCLGMQAMVTVFGGSVEAGFPAHGEVARIEHDDRGVFRGVPQRFAAVRYHSLRAVTLPDCLEATASCPGAEEDRRSVLMGVRHRHLPLEGVQFHPESVLTEHGAALVGNFLRLRR